MNESEKSLPRVICRAWGNEPVALVAFGLHAAGKWVLVGQPHAKKPIGLPATDVFDYDESRFLEMRRAFAENNIVALQTLYAESPAFEFKSRGSVPLECAPRPTANGGILHHRILERQRE